MPNHSYSNLELTDIHFCYGLANGNSREACRLYAGKFPNRRIPCRKVFVNVHRNLRERGTLKFTEKTGRVVSVGTLNNQERVLTAVEENPSTSVRRISLEHGISKSSVWRILHNQQLYPYHIQRVQCLTDRDFPPRFNLCQWFLQKIALFHLFLSNILFTDEAGFSREGIFNFHNNHCWADENPQEISQRRHQVRFSLNVWIGIVGDNLIGPMFLPNRLNGVSYLNFLTQDLPELLEELPLYLRNNMWYMQDGAPPHFSLDVRQHLNQVFGNKWIGRGGPIPWPARSPDLNPLDFFVWGYLKSLVYRTPVDNIEDLRERIVAGCEVIRQKPGVFEKMRQSMRKRMDCVIEMNGRHIEHLL